MGRPDHLPGRVVVGENGAYWRDFDDYYSMCPTSDDNDPVVPVAVYVPEADLDRTVASGSAGGKRVSIERLTELLAAATPTEPWRIEGTYGQIIFGGDDDKWVASTNWHDPDSWGRTDVEYDEIRLRAALIVALRNAAPELLAVVAAARVVIEQSNDDNLGLSGSALDELETTLRKLEASE